MAHVLNTSALTLNPKESPEFEAFIQERIFEQPILASIHRIWPGIKMKEQIVFASLMGKTGIADAACTRPASGATSVMTQKYWEPANIGDTFVLCQAEVNALFKAYYDKITAYAQKFDIEGSDEMRFIAALVEDSASKAIARIVWFGHKAVAAAGANTAGLKAAGDVKFYSMIDGLWTQIFAAVTAGTVQKADVKTSSELTFDEMWLKADVRLRAAADKQLLVSRTIFDNYTKSLRDKSQNFTIELTTEGMQTVRWNGIPVVNMETIWDLNLNDFVSDTTTNGAYLPERAILTVPANIPVGTLNEGDFDQLEAWYNRDERQNKIAYGMTIDAKVLEGYMIVAAYGTFEVGN
jgi:hypothetical protein